jgi:hypothetical protein
MEIKLSRMFFWDFFRGTIRDCCTLQSKLKKFLKTSANVDEKIWFITFLFQPLIQEEKKNNVEGKSARKRFKIVTPWPGTQDRVLEEM